ncbi:unnamed protein product [Lota lota]
MWSVSGVWTGPRGSVMLITYPQMLRGGYRRAMALHYMSSFSDTDNCAGGDDSNSCGSSMDRQINTDRINY